MHDDPTSVEPLLLGRFEVLEELGEGGFGRVLRCFDRETQSTVAVKQLRRFGIDALLAFKSEFRLLSDLSHENLVRLGELFEGEGQWAFSLEYVPGSDFLTWVRPPERAGRLHEGRLREGLVQLVHGLSALHGAGLLHRDVKPANVRVTPEGRVVLLDFGLVARLGTTRGPDDWGLGTVAYMAPEQALPGPVGHAADWYALGALLYEALTGELPFAGPAFQVLLKKQRELPPSPSRLNPAVPRDLEELCLGLLLPEPTIRRTGAHVLEMLRPSASRSLPAPARRADVFVGRRSELTALEAAFARARDHGLTLAVIEGESGIGKSALMQQLTSELHRRERELVVLEGRCHAAEQVPYKAFDGCVDGLLRSLRGLDDAALAALLPAEPALLPLLFPLLRGVKAIERAAAAREPEAPERFPLFQAFAELLANTARARPLVMGIDDLQWSDLESLLLLEHLLEARRDARVLIVATMRPLTGSGGELEPRLSRLLERSELTRVRLAPLPLADMRALGAALLELDEDDTAVRRVGSASAGHPLFLQELVERVRSGASEAEGNLEHTILERVRALPKLARSTLELIALEGAPTPQRVLGQALQVSGDELTSALALLRTGRLLSLVQRGNFVCYHDRIRETVLASLPPGSQPPLHRKLAVAWQDAPQREPTRLARHWLAAGQGERALVWLELAAREAEDKAAYEHAADLYRTMLSQEALRAEPREASRIVRALGEALARAGHYAEAADAFARALLGAEPLEKAELLGMRAQQLLQAGHVEPGLAAAEEAFRAVGLTWVKGTSSALARLMVQRAKLRLRGLELSVERASEPAPEQRAKLDTLWRLSSCVLWTDLPRGLELIARHLSMSLDLGAPEHVARGLYMEAVSASMQAPESALVARLRTAASSWSERVASPSLRAFAHYCEGSTALFQGKPVGDHFAQAELLYRRHCPGEPWEAANARASALSEHYYAGRYDLLAERSEAWVRAAQHRGDRFAYAALSIVGLGFVRHLVEDRPEQALAEIHEAMEPWRARTFGMQHLAELLAESQVYMYVGGDALARYYQERWPRVKNTLVVRSGLPSEILRTLRAMGALHAAFAKPHEPAPRQLAAARKLSRSLRDARTPLGRSYAAIIAAQLAFLAGDAQAVTRFSERALALRTAPTSLPACLVDLLGSALQGGSLYQAREHMALNALASLGVVNPERMLRSWFPILPVLRAHVAR